MAGFVESGNGMKLVFNCMEIGFESLTCFMVVLRLLELVLRLLDMQSENIRNR